MNPAFEYEVTPGRVVFGCGARVRLASELDRLGAGRTLLVAAREEKALADEVTARLGGRSVGRFEDVVQHVPIERAESARLLASELDVDTVVALGGGSAIGFGKAIALESDVSLVAIPTTYAGSEMTPIWGLTERGEKRTGRDVRVKPRLVVYDPELTLSLPGVVAGPSGMNALAHAAEALYAPGRNPVVEAIALDAVAHLQRALPRVVAAPGDLEARSEALLGAHLAACALADAGTALHHKTCHVLGGMFDLDHGGMNAVVLPHALRYTAPAIPRELTRLNQALQTRDACRALFDLASALETPPSLAALGMPEDGIENAAAEITRRAVENPQPPQYSAIERMLRFAWAGTEPEPTSR